MGFELLQRFIGHLILMLQEVGDLFFGEIETVPGLDADSGVLASAFSFRIRLYSSQSSRIDLQLRSAPR